MKKLLTLLFTIVMVVILVSGLSANALDPFEKPLECSEADASVVVTHTGKADAKYYFEDLTQEVIDWSCQQLKGKTTITLLKDIDVSIPTGTNHYVFNMRTNNSYWYESTFKGNELIIDLNGKTILCEGDANLFSLTNWGLTVKNGTIEYANTSTNLRAVFYYGTTTGATGTSSGTNWAPVLVLEDLNIYNNSDKASSIVRSFIHTMKVNATNCNFWNANGEVFVVDKTDQSGLGDTWKLFEGDYVAKYTAEKCILGSDTTYALRGVDEAGIVSLIDCVVVDSPDAGENKSKLTIDDNDAPVEEVEDWTGTLPNGTAVAGYATIYGDAPGNAPLLFLDVPEDAWYYTFVQELYNAKIIAGMDEFTFAPDGTLTYGQALKLITLGIGEAEQAPVAGGNWASGYVAFAKTKGWLAADVDPNAPITRLAFCQIAAKAKNLTDKAENKFTDCDDASVLALVKAGVINGMTETTFAPNNQLTRAQISKIISLLRKL